MKVLIIFLVYYLIYVANGSPNTKEAPQGNASDGQENIEDIFKPFEEKVTGTVDIIKNYGKEIDELTKNALEKSSKETRANVGAIFKDAEEIIAKFNKIKRKTIENLLGCKDKFIGESGVIGHLLALGEEIEYAVKEVNECPEDFRGTECLINTMVRGELVMDEADQMIEKENDTPQGRADALIKYIEACNQRTVESVKEKIQTFMDDIKKCA